MIKRSMRLNYEPVSEPLRILKAHRRLHHASRGWRVIKLFDLPARARPQSHGGLQGFHSPQILGCYVTNFVPHKAS